MNFITYRLTIFFEWIFRNDFKFHSDDQWFNYKLKLFSRSYVLIL